MLKRLMMVLTVATLVGGNVAFAQNFGGSRKFTTQGDPSPLNGATVGRSPSINSSNPQDRSGSSNPQDLTQPRAINPQDMNPPNPNIVMPLSR
jgi:hypothetical protein